LRLEATLLCTQTPTAQWPSISRFWCHFFASDPQLFGQHDSPRNLAEPRYHQHTPFKTISSQNAVKGSRSVRKQVALRQRLFASPPPATSSSEISSCWACFFAKKPAGAYFHPRICVCVTFSFVANETAAVCGKQPLLELL